MTKPPPIIWKQPKPKRVDKLTAKFDVWLEEQFPSPKVVEEYVENGIVIKRYEAR